MEEITRNKKIIDNDFVTENRRIFPLKFKYCQNF